MIGWLAASAALGSSLPCSGGEQRMLKITASLADGIPVDLGHPHRPRRRQPPAPGDGHTPGVRKIILNSTWRVAWERAPQYGRVL